MAWLYLVLAGCSEIAWPVGLKLSQISDSRWIGLTLAVARMAASGFLLWAAQRHIPIGTAYAVWTGIGAAGTFVVGLTVFGDAASVGRFIGVTLIVSGVATLEQASS